MLASQSGSNHLANGRCEIRRVTALIGLPSEGIQGFHSGEQTPHNRPISPRTATATNSPAAAPPDPGARLSRFRGSFVFSGTQWSRRSSVAPEAEITSRFQWELAACRGRRRFTSRGPRLRCGAVWPASPRCSPAWDGVQNQSESTSTSVGRCSKPERIHQEIRCFATTLLASVERCSR